MAGASSFLRAFRETTMSENRETWQGESKTLIKACP